jgi:predicted NACHT family NTPase
LQHWDAPGIYTNVNILEKITGRRRLDISELLQNCEPEDFERFGLNRVSEKRVPGLEAVQRYSKLMVLGKPGAGKTTFLKYLAMQCIEGQFQTNRVPLFITLKDFAEAPKQPDLLEYIAQQLSGCGMIDGSVKAEQLLRQDKVLVLLDGLDEVREEDTKRVLTQIRDVADQFHTNQFVITCRIAAKDYTFERFTEVEVADFNQKQIAIFAQNWFRLSDPMKAERFIQKLKENEPIRELATNPLLLTLLCLVFGETADFAANRSELYKEGLDVLLKKWDAKRNIERDQVYKNLSVQRKEDLLSQIALTTFEKKDYFFKQKTIEAYIGDFIRNLRDADPDPEVLQLDSEAVLKSIEAQHGLMVERAKGIYSFSHLTFQEYFTAREIVANSTWDNLIEHITEKRWREVFLLTTGMLRKADNLVHLMKQKIDGLVGSDPKLQQFLTWLNQKAVAVNNSYKPAAIRAVYFSFICAHTRDRVIVDNYEIALAASIEQPSFGRKYWFSHEIKSAFRREFSLLRNLNYVCIYSEKLVRARDRSHSYAYKLEKCMNTAIKRARLDFKHLLREFQEKIPSPDLAPEMHKKWWKLNGEDLSKTFRNLLIENCNIGHDWQFSYAQMELLQQYHDANLVLVDCLNSDCYVSREVRQEIEDTLLLPMAEIEKWQQGKVS